MRNFTKYLYPLLVLVTSIGLAASAAFFSITGLSKLFAGAEIAVMVMASILELAKIITASWLHKNWFDKAIARGLKIQLTIAVVVLMSITSAGIYGFLSNAYFGTSSKLTKIETAMTLNQKQQEIYQNKITNLSQIKDSKSDRIKKQGARLDSLYKKGMNTNSRTTNGQIKEINKDIDLLSKEIDEIETKIQVQNDSISKIEIKNAELSNSDVAAEVGPLKYISRLTGKPMDEIINWFILALIFVFDPLAIALLIAANISMEKASKKQDVIKEKQNVDPNIPIEQINDFFVSKKESEENFKKKLEKIKEEKEIVEQVGQIGESELIVEPEEDSDESMEESEQPVEIVEPEENITEQEEETFYMKLLSILFKGGTLKVGDLIQPYDSFLRDIRNERISYSESVIRDFLIVCNREKIVDTSDGSRKILKDYASSKEIIKKI